MTSCFLKLYTPTRVCEVIIRNWSAGQLVITKKPAFNAGEWTYESPTRPPHRGEEKGRGTEGRKGRDVDVRNANEMRTVEEAKRRLINQ